MPKGNGIQSKLGYTLKWRKEAIRLHTPWGLLVKYASDGMAIWKNNMNWLSMLTSIKKNPFLSEWLNKEFLKGFSPTISYTSRV